jgi:hypothetical protein
MERAHVLQLFLALVLALGLPGAPLEQRIASWPAWHLPAPLPRPGQADLIYPIWFEGQWLVRSHDLGGREPDLAYPVRFEANGQGQVVGDRAFNASSIGHALLGEQLLAVRNDPLNPNRQLAELAGDQRLESTVVGRRSAELDSSFLADELALQVLHGPGDPRVSRVETLSRYRRLSPDRIAAEQWQASYGSPAQGLRAEARSSWHGSLVLERLDPALDPPLQTSADP